MASNTDFCGYKMDEDIVVSYDLTNCNEENYRYYDANGRVFSYNVANLQFALSGRGSISRSQNEGIFNRFIKYLF